MPTCSSLPDEACETEHVRHKTARWCMSVPAGPREEEAGNGSVFRGREAESHGGSEEEEEEEGAKEEAAKTGVGGGGRYVFSVSGGGRR